MVLVTIKANLVLKRVGTSSPTHRPTGRVLGLRGWRLSTVKTLQQWDLLSFLVGEHVQVLGGWRTRRGHGSPGLFPICCPMHLLHWAVPQVYRYNCVSWWSLALIQHQWESPIWGAVNKETSVQVPQLWYSTAVRTSVKQHCCKMALEQSPPLARQLSSALSCSSLVHSSTLCSGEILLVFHLQPGDTIFTVGWKGKVPSLSQWRADL